MRLLALIPAFGVGVVRAPGLSKEIRRQLFLLHLLPYLILGGIMIVAFAGLASPVTPLNAACAWLPFVVGLYALLARGILPAGEPKGTAAGACSLPGRAGSRPG